MNHKRIYRLCRLEGLGMRPKKPRRHVTACRRIETPVATEVNESWSMDFMSDQLFNGSWIWLLTLVDNFTHESLAIEVADRIGGQRLVEVLMRVVQEKGIPKSIRVYNGTKFTSKILDQWAYLNRVELGFIQPGKPTDNALIEAFNGRFRQECLNKSWSLSLEDAMEKVDEWWQHYNRERPRRSLGKVSPVEFA